MRVSVTLSDSINELITKHAKSNGISKDKLISGIVEDWVAMCKADNSTDENSKLRDELEKAREEIKQLQQQLKSRHNERGAGRKQQYGEAHKFAMKSYKASGMSYRDIAKIYDCSVGTVYKLINEHN